MPADDDLRLNDDQGRAPIAPEAREPDPEDAAVGRRGRRFFEERLSTTIWWRKARISAWRARRDRKLKRRVEVSEESTAAMG